MSAKDEDEARNHIYEGNRDSEIRSDIRDEEWDDLTIESVTDA